MIRRLSTVPAVRRLGIAALSLFTASPALAIDLAPAEARVVRAPAGAEIVVIGNPSIADVVFRPNEGIFILLGKATGATNLVAVDVDGRTVMNTPITVGATASAGRVTVHRGALRHSYQCAPNCDPVPVAGDDVEYFTAAIDAQTRMIQAARAESAPQ